MRKQIKEAKDGFRQEQNALIEELSEKLSEVMFGIKLPAPIMNTASNVVLISSNRKVTKSAIQKLASHYNCWGMEECELRDKIDEIITEFVPKFEENEARRAEFMAKVEAGEIFETIPLFP